MARRVVRRWQAAFVACALVLVIGNGESRPVPGNIGNLDDRSNDRRSGPAWDHRVRPELDPWAF
jgi:hypothetical protein